MLEKNDLIQLKARTLERLQEVNVEDYTLDQTDIRLKDYVKSAISHPDDHNLYELLSILRFFRLLDAYIFNRGQEVYRILRESKIFGIERTRKVSSYPNSGISICQYPWFLPYARKKALQGRPIIRTT